jgi:VWFA-related protein
MISFVTYFLLLVIGVHPVQVAVSSDVEWVELRLDGVLVGRADREPWTIECDFGDRLRPHELVASAFGGEGQHLAEVRQWINMPRPKAEVGVLLERDENGYPAVARVTWEAVGDELTATVTSTLDGNALVVDDLRRIALPDMARDRAHVLAVTVDFGNGIEASEEVAFGGFHGSEVSSELTAVPVVTDDDSKKPSLDMLQGHFSVNGTSVRVLGLERGQGQIVIVRDRITGDPAASWFNSTRQRVVGGRGMFGALTRGDRIRVMLPFASDGGGGDFRSFLFPTSPWYTEFDIPRLIVKLNPPPTKGRSRTVVDAVAVAGVEAARGNHPRGVVLLLGRSVEDHSTHTPSEVRRFLGDLNVPLFVWRLGREEHSGWPGADYVGTYSKLTDAVARLRRSLDSQRIVWIEGRHLPQSVHFAGAADSIRPVGGFEGTYCPDEDLDCESVAVDDPPTPPDGTPTFAGEVEVIVVNIEAFVRDRKGRPITDLNREDFRLVVDDVETPISHFSFETGPEFARQEQDVVVPNQQTRGPLPAHVVLFVDNQNLTPSSRRRVLDDTARFVADNVGPSVEMMVVKRQLGLEVVQPFTNRGDEVVAAIDSMRTSTGALTSHQALRVSILNQIAACDALPEGRAETCRRRVRGVAERAAFEERQRILQTIRDLGVALESLGSLPGRKSMIYVSNGLPMIAGLDLVLPVVDSAAMSRLRPALDCSREFAALVDTSLRSGVSLYTVDAAGLEVPVGLSARVSNPVLHEFDFELTSNVDASILFMAQATGGLAVVNTNSISAGLDRLHDDLFSYYSIGFTVSASRRDTPHRIEIQLPEREDLKVRHRAVVYEKSADTRAREVVMAGLMIGESDNPIEIEVVHGDAMPANKGVSQIPLRIVVPIANISLAPNEKDGSFRGKLLVFAASKDEDERTSKIAHQAFDVVVRGEDLTQAIRQAFAIETSILVASSDVSVSLAVADPASGVVSYLSFPPHPPIGDGAVEPDTNHLSER